MKIQILLVILALAIMAEAQGPRYCGRVLAETMAQICQFGEKKRSQDSWTKSDLFGRGSWLAPQQAVAMRGKRYEGIATKCCENSCTINEMMAYCS